MQTVLYTGRLFSRAIANGIFSSVLGVPEQQSSNNSTTPSGSSTSSSCSSSSSGPNNTIVNASRSAGKRLRFLTAASGFSKNHHTAAAVAAAVRPGKFGDDAYFIARHALADVIGVADGVGGWRAWGIDPGEFSHSLMVTCERLVVTGSFSPSEPGAIIARAYYELLENKSHILGSSTACVVVLQGEALRLSSANIGDSGFLVVRDGTVVHRSQEQQHYFNTPFQLSLPPPGTSQHVLSDRPESALRGEFSVREGDMLMVATDGVFDNLPDSLIIKELIKLLSSPKFSTKSMHIYACGDHKRKGNFDELYMLINGFCGRPHKARRSGINYPGGKPDDITVVLATMTV
ncbi:unnamed protein product, partial [Meganyctiphanes norvegica]